MPEGLEAPMRCRLDTLPIEIIRRIAPNGSFVLVISLLQVNRALYNACSDWTVFQSIIKNSASHIDTRSKWDPTPSLPRDCSVWSRYAYADSKAFQFINSSHEVTALQLNKWLPNLMALHLYPILAHSHMLQLSRIIECARHTDTLALRFCLVACSMIETPYHDLDYNTKIEFYSKSIGQALANVDQFDLETLDMNLHMFPFTEKRGVHPGLPHGHDPGSPTVFLLHMAYKVLPVIYYELVHEIKQGKLRDPSEFKMTTSIPRAIPLPPTAFTIPFSSFTQIPLPFSLGCAEMFSTCHLAVMTSPDFIERGEWTGYFGGQLHSPLQNRSMAIFELPMEGIKFSVSTHKGDPEILDLRSVGNANDYKGEFYFEGELWRASGKNNLRRWYKNFPLDLSLQALMTPFGIVASWGVAEGYWMWLWKSEWSAGLVDL